MTITNRPVRIDQTFGTSSMADIQVAIAGQDAVAATEALLAIEGISGTYAVDSKTDKEGILVTIATIVGIVGGTLAIAGPDTVAARRIT